MLFNVKFIKIVDGWLFLVLIFNGLLDCEFVIFYIILIKVVDGGIFKLMGI